MPPLNLPLTVWGRPVKPLAIGVAVAMIVLALAGVLDKGALGITLWGDIVAMAAFTSFAAFMGGWWGRSQAMAEIALLTACGVFTARGMALFMLHFELLDVPAWLSLASAVTAGGAYVLERVDPRAREVVPRVDPS